MAGEWIKVRTNLWDDPRVSQLCDLTGSPEAMIVGALYWLWASADEHTETGLMPGLSLGAIDRKTGVKGLGAALVTIGWVEDSPEGVIICRFGEHNGVSAKTRAQTAKRVSNHKGNAKVTQAALPEQQDSVSTALPREEKRREDKEEKAKSKADAAPRARKPAKFPLPDGFALSDSIIAWAAKNGHGNLQAHFDSFIRKARANGYAYADWDQALQNAIVDDWAKLKAPQARGSPAGYQTATEKAKEWTDRLTGRHRNEPDRNFDFIDINERPT